MLNIEIKDGIKFRGLSAFITFKYNESYVQLMRSMPKRYWHSKSKEWEIPQKDIGLVLNGIGKNEYSVTGDYEIVVNEDSNEDTNTTHSNVPPVNANTNPKDSYDYKLVVDSKTQKDIQSENTISIPDNYVFKTKPFQHQIEGITYGLNHKKFLLADEQGAGKSKQMIDLACINKLLYGYKHCLVIACVNGLKYNWQEEVSIHSNESGYILGTRTNRKGTTTIGSNTERLDDLNRLLENPDAIPDYFIITNIETLRYKSTEQVPLKTKGKDGKIRYKKVTKFPIVEVLQKLISKNIISMIVADEVHKCFSRDTPVLTDKGYIPIKDIVENKCYKVATMNGDGEKEFVTPVNYFINPKQSQMLKLTIDTSLGHKDIICTPNHKFLTVNRGYIEAKDLEWTDDIKTIDGGFGILQRIETIPFDDVVYDIEIPISHNYIIDGGIVVHNCKDSTSLQGRALLSLHAESVVALTGTPLMNNAIDLYTPLKFIDKEKHSLYSFKQHYCICGGFGGHQIVGYKNLSELQNILDTCMLRRLKKDVLDLPEKIYIKDYVEMTKSQLKIYTSVLENLRENLDKIKLSPNPLTMLIRLRQATGNPSMLSSSISDNPKFERVLELMDEIVQNNHKAIIFSNWTDVLCPMYELLQSKGYNPALYTGLNKDTREDEKRKFKQDSSCKVICGTIGAMGTGLTLTEATTVIFLDEPWNRAIKDQAEDRAHRIGTKESLNVITIMCRNTIDEKIHNIVYRKGKMSDIIVDKEEDLFRNPQVLNYLLSE